MKEFEKFWRDEDNDKLSELWDGPPNAKGFAKLAWKAALEWALNRESSWEIKKELEE